VANVRHDVSVSGRVTSAVRAGGQRGWSTADFPQFPASAVTATLRRLAKNGELRPIRHGLYWRGEKYRFGMGLPDSIALARSLTRSVGVGWAGLSASNVLGLTTQVPAAETIAVPGPAPRPTPGVRFLSRSSKHLRATAELNPLEVALLEVLSDWTRVIDVAVTDAVEILAGVVSDGSVRPDRLVVAAAGERGPTRDRLRKVLEAAGHQDHAEAIRPSSTVKISAKALAGI
jgi:hypothetical protein